MLIHVGKPSRDTGRGLICSGALVANPLCSSVVSLIAARNGLV